MPASSDPRLIVETLRLGPLARRLVAYLARHFGQWCEKEMLLCALYGDDPDGGPLLADKCLHLHVHDLRPVLAKHGLALENGYGRYRMVWLPETSA